MLKGRIYWFTGEASNSRELAKKLHTLLQSEKQNWRSDVFYLDSDELRTLTNNKDYTCYTNESLEKIKNLWNARIR